MTTRINQFNIANTATPELANSQSWHEIPDQ